MKYRKRLFSVAVAWALLSACVMGVPLRTLETGGIEETGTMTLFLYGCHYADDLENIAVLVREPSRYPFAFFAPETAYKVKTGVPAAEALREAQRFLGCSIRLDALQVSAILAEDGIAAGYEVRPLYSPLEFGRYDILDVRYSLKRGAVTVYIELDRDVQEKIFPFVGPDPGNSP